MLRQRVNNRAFSLRGPYLISRIHICAISHNGSYLIAYLLFPCACLCFAGCGISHLFAKGSCYTWEPLRAFFARRRESCRWKLIHIGKFCLNWLHRLHCLQKHGKRMDTGMVRQRLQTHLVRQPPASSINSKKTINKYHWLLHVIHKANRRQSTIEL